MRVLAIDPGYDRLGIAVLEGTGLQPQLIHSTCIETSKNRSFTERLEQVGVMFDDLLQTHTPQVVAIETLFFNKNVKTAMNVAHIRGVLLFLATQAGCSIHEFSPQAIKVAVTGYGNSDKAAVTLMVKRLLPNTPTTAHDDEYDAIAVGITYLAHQRASR